VQWKGCAECNGWELSVKKPSVFGSDQPLWKHLVYYAQWSSVLACRFVNKTQLVYHLEPVGLLTVACINQLIIIKFRRDQLMLSPLALATNKRYRFTILQVLAVLCQSRPICEDCKSSF